MEDKQNRIFRWFPSDGCAMGERENKTETVVDGPHQSRVDREWSIGRRGTRRGCSEATSVKRRCHISGRRVDEGGESTPN